MQTDPLILIAARSGRMREGYQAVLTVIPQTRLMEPVDDATLALKMVAEGQPALVLLDTNLPDGQVWMLLEQIKTRRPQIQCLVLVDNVRQLQTAQATGADGVLIKGASAERFYATIDELLSRHRE